ncbi:predicted protein [Plenodomus lingam JN3]|uniref:Predicted protein n=1 Tax=Leptosphaeria maculans (strain JN3 / isolate v23.1.3 / race Av1-4-5-6-7-8) TaxID=985895 RepID=E5A9M2_LEPMJ|nr:predicted protein [Plenodomus lingam JN3]CBY00363.1 predicted protein [Plenodomus lingam JN3]
MAPKASKPSRWTDEEVAFLLNYGDECLHDKKNFRDTSEVALLAFTGREATKATIARKITTYLKMCNPDAVFSDFTEQGLRCIDASVLSASILTALRQQRPTHIGDLQFRETEEPSGPAEGVMSGGRQRTQKSYRESSVAESDLSKEDPGDAEYVNDAARVKGKMPSDSNTVAVSQAKKHLDNHVSAGGQIEPKISSKAAGKRKASSSEVFDLVNDNDTAPPPKRPAHDKGLLPTLESSNSGNTQTQGQAPLSLASINDQSEDISRDKRADKPWVQSPGESEPEQISEGNISLVTRHFWGNKYAAEGASQAEWQNRTDIETLQRQLNHLNSLVMFKLKRDLTHEEISDTEVRILLERVDAERIGGPARLARELLDIANDCRAAKDDALDTLKAAFNWHEPGTTLMHPPIPTARELVNTWRDAEHGYKEAFSNVLAYSIQGEVLTDVSAGYVACAIDGLLADSSNPVRSNLMSGLGIHLQSGHAMRALMSALFCRWLFDTPDELCADHHSMPQLLQYQTIALSDGLPEVQRLDKVAFSAFFATEHYKTTTFPIVVKSFLKHFDIITKVCPGALGLNNTGNPSHWAAEVLKLKQRLMISPHDYRVYFCHPGIPFDREWMKAENLEGETLKPEEVGTRKVRLCLFPALVEQDAEEFDEGQRMEDALFKNKKFLPSWEDRSKFDVKRVRGKAAVLVEEAEA